MSLQYPLLFSFGGDGYHVDIKIRLEDHENIERKRKKVALIVFILYRIQDNKHVKYGNTVHF